MTLPTWPSSAEHTFHSCGDPDCCTIGALLGYGISASGGWKIDAAYFTLLWPRQWVTNP